MHPTVAIELQVTRHPFSFIGDHDGEALDGLVLKREGTWKERLLDYVGGNEAMRDQAMAGMRLAGSRVGIEFDYSCFINRQPVDSQRMLLYAARHGVQEKYVSALSSRHFENGARGHSASKRHTVLAAAEAAGLDRAAASAFYDSDELRGVVWRSYGDMPRRGISAIPLFVFNVPEIGLEGGPLRPDAPGNQFIVNGSMDEHVFVEIFEELWRRVEQARATRGLRGPAAAAAAATATKEEAAAAALLHQRVSLHSLLAKPSLNGQHGRVFRYDRSKGRCAVRLEGVVGEVLAIRPANLALAPEAEEPPAPPEPPVPRGQEPAAQRAPGAAATEAAVAADVAVEEQMAEEQAAEEQPAATDVLQSNGDDDDEELLMY